MPENCPYHDLPPTSFWRSGVAESQPANLDPVISVPFTITRDDKIATAGSCFAQHLANRIAASGHIYFLTEPGYPRLTGPLKTAFNYGTFSARFGNIYTTRQLLQLALRAYGVFKPAEDFWRNGPHWVDPFRPLIQPEGFETREEAELDRAQHLAAVRRMMEELDVFIFTLGLTETWVCKSDGAVLPVCPGCGAGRFDPDKYEFKNFEVDEVTADFLAFAEQLRRVNPASRIILTVSPVPLVATYSPHHVLPATVYSKSVLRVAADRIARTLSNCAYFPSYEIITSPSARGRYFAEDLRNVTNDGVDHVMRVFFRHYCDASVIPVTATPEPKDVTSRSGDILDAICDEYASLRAHERAVK